MKAISRHAVVVVAAGLLLSAASFAQQPGMVPPDDPAAANMVSDDGQPDPANRVARIAVLQGNASFEPASVEQFSPAELNYPMTSGDRLYAGQGTVAEIQTGQIAVRLGQNTDLTVSAMTDTLAQFGLASGSVHLRTWSLAPGTTTELDTPNAAVTVLQPGDIRVDVDPNSSLSYLTVVSGEVQVDGAGFEQTFGPGSSVALNGTNPLEASSAAMPTPDGLDSFSSDRDNQFLAEEQTDGQYVNDATIGAGDLGDDGDWSSGGDDGPVWYPRGVAPDWAPYVFGHWAWIAPWGWTWVESEPWGFAPFHYGRWVHEGGRWGWIPGAPIVHPIYAPALVVFVGGGGVTGWFPLGPHEVYTPWYHVSPLYLNRVNVSNLYSRDTVSVRAAYNARTLRPEFVAAAAGRPFAYRGNAVGVSESAFAAGKPVASSRLRGAGDPLAQAQVLVHPNVSPTREIVAPGPARVVPTRLARPVLDAHAQPGQVAGAPVQRRSTLAPVPNPAPAFHPGASATPQPAPQQPEQRTQPANGEAVQQTPNRRVFTPERTPEPSQAQPQEQTPAAPQRSLYNRATPPEPRPSFDQQREAIQSTEPGRPLSPRQMDTVRQSAPAPQPHPAPPSRTPPPSPPSPPAKPK